MKYQEVLDMAIAYSDRSDIEVVENMDNFLRIVESRINTRISVDKQFARATIPTFIDQQYYGLPSDFITLRDIQIQTVGDTNYCTPKYVSPEQMNKEIAAGNTELIYTLLAQQIQIYPTIDAQQIEIVYARNIPELNDVDVNNWISNQFPNVYIFGILVEIASFVKDVDAGTIWEQRFQAELSTLTQQDDMGTWSGPSLRITLA